MNKSTKNKLERFAQFIEKLPKKAFNMTTWVTVGDEDCEVVELRNIEPCGTTCCLAGWRAVQKGKQLDRDGYIFKEYESVKRFARLDLGLTPEEADALFYPCKWPNKEGSTEGRWSGEDKENYTKFPNTPKGAANRIRYFIKEGK